MASYLSYFTSNSSGQAQPYQQQRPTTPSSSTWSGAFSSRLSTLRKALTKDSEEDDPDTEDCSHVSNVLRAYYTEKGRQFPEWLPPDPKKPPPVVAPPAAQYGQYGNTYGGYGASQYGSQPSHGRGGSAGRTGLSDLWDSAPSQNQPQAPVVQSLRPPRPTPPSLRSQDSTGSMGGAAATNSYNSQPGTGSRPLPSQRAGSYQNTASASTAALGSKDRLRARLQGGERSNSPLSSSGGRQAYNPTDSYTTQGSSGSASPYVSASEPWSTGGDEYGYGREYSGSSGGGLSNMRQRPGGPR